MDEDVEGMQSTIYFLQQQLKEAKDQVVQLQTENAQLKNMVDRGMINPDSKRTEGDEDNDAMDTSFEETPRGVPVETAQDNMHPAGGQRGDMGGMPHDSGIIAQQQQQSQLQQNQMDNNSSSAAATPETIVIQPTTEAGADTPSGLRTTAASVTGNGMHPGNAYDFAAGTQPPPLNTLGGVVRTEAGPNHEGGHGHDQRLDSREGTPTLEEQNSMDTSDSYVAEKQQQQLNPSSTPPPQDNGYVSPTNSHSTNCHDSSNIDSTTRNNKVGDGDVAKQEQVSTTTRDNGEESMKRPERSATPTLDDHGDQNEAEGSPQRTLNAKGDGIGGLVTKALGESKELPNDVQNNGLIGTQYDSSQDEL